MATAREVLREVRRDLRPVEQEVLAHPFIQAIEQGKVHRPTLQVFAKEQFHIVRSDVRSIAFMLSRFGGTPHREFFAALLEGDLKGLETLLTFAKALGLAEDELRVYQPSPQAHAYTAYLAWMALYASEAETATAFFVNLHAWGSNCARMAEGLKTRYGFQQQEVAFFELFGAPARDLEQRVLSVVNYGLARGTTPEGIRRTARLLQGYELMFWDAMYQAHIGPAGRKPRQ